MKRLALVFGLMVSLSPAWSRMVEEQFDLPVRVTDAFGKKIAHDVHVTVFRDDAAGAPRPVAVVDHGRSAEAQERVTMGRARFPVAARWLVQMGFVVAVPTRIGYGVTGGDDAEDTPGPCEARNFGPGLTAAAEQTLAVLKAMRERSDVRSDRAIVIGVSFGGATAVAVAALAPPGVDAAINFAGGAGGNPKLRPGRPCSAHLMERLFAEYGRRARMPTLWIYAENDRFFGPEHPKTWFDAFRKAGGNGEFVQLPPTGEDGHRVFVEFPALWQPLVADFLHRQGYPAAEGAR